MGDGATDREARPAVDAFAAYAGVVERPAALDGADFVLREPSLAAVLALACTDDDRARLADTQWGVLLGVAKSSG